MSDPVRFLNAFAHSLGVMTLYPEGHPSRERAVDSAFDELDGLTLPGGHLPAFTFLEDEVVFGRERLRELKSWDWGKRLVAAGIERLELERRVTREEFNSFLEEVLARLMLSAVDSEEFIRLSEIAGANGHIPKSEMHRRLLHEVHQYLPIAQSK